MSDQNKGTVAILAALGYDAKWLQYGFVDAAFLEGQMARFRTGDDPHSEHYRYAAFLRILESRTTLDDGNLARYVELATLDRDRTMAEAALTNLVRWPGLTKAQRAWLQEHPALTAPAVQRAFQGRTGSNTPLR